MACIRLGLREQLLIIIATCLGGQIFRAKHIEGIKRVEALYKLFISNGANNTELHCHSLLPINHPHSFYKRLLL